LPAQTRAQPVHNCTEQTGVPFPFLMLLLNPLPPPQVIVCICVGSVWIYAPELFASYNQSVKVSDPGTNRTRSLCLMSRTVLIQMVGSLSSPTLNKAPISTGRQQPLPSAALRFTHNSRSYAALHPARLLHLEIDSCHP
jgi:hypothetical protein